MFTRQCIVFALLLLLLSLGFGLLVGVAVGADVLITDLFSCDRFGVALDYFPLETTVYFNISLRNVASDPKNVTVDVSVLDVTNVPIGLDELNTIIAENATEQYIMGVLIPKWARLGYATAYASVFVEGKLVDSESTQFYIGPTDLTPPVVNILSPENVSYGSNTVPLVFTVDERPYWIGYSLNYQENVTVRYNSTLTGLVYGPYNIIVYVNDSSGNMGFSQVYFTILVVHDIAVTGLHCSPVRLLIGEFVNVSVSVLNEGTVVESFSVSVLGNTTVIETLAVADLSVGDNLTLGFVWNTTGAKRGNHTMSAYVAPVLGETDTGDNTLVDGVVTLRCPGDLNNDGVVDIADVVLVTSVYRSKCGDPEYRLVSDVIEDCVIDIADVVAVTVHYRETC